jgi:hypothetical protein
MRLLKRRRRPEPWSQQLAEAKYAWLVPIFALEWVWRWLAYLLSGWAFLEVLELFRHVFPIDRGCIVFFGEQGPDKAKALPSLAGD